MISRRNMLYTVGAFGLAGSLPACSPATVTAVAAAAPSLIPEAELALQVVYGLIVTGGFAMGKKMEGALHAIDAGTRLLDAGGKVVTAANPPAPPGPQVAVATQPGGATVADPKPVDAAIASQTSVQNGVTATIQFPSPPLLPGQTRPAIGLYVTSLIWTPDGRQFRGKGTTIPAEQLMDAISIFAPDLQQPELPGPGVYRFGYELSEEEGGPTLTGGGPILQMLADGDFGYERILREHPDAEPRPDEVYSRTYASNPQDDLVLRGLVA